MHPLVIVLPRPGESNCGAAMSLGKSPPGSVSSCRRRPVPVRRMARQYTWYLASGLRRNDGRAGFRRRLSGARRWCRDVAGKGAIRFSVVVAAQAGTQAAHGAATDVFWIPACAGMTAGGVSAAVVRVPAVVPRCRWERRHPVQCRRSGAGRYPVRRMVRQQTCFLDSGLRRNDGQAGFLLRLFGAPGRGAAMSLQKAQPGSVSS